MFRSAGQRLLPALCRNRQTSDHFIRSVYVLHSPRLFSTSTTSEPIKPNQNPTHFDTASTAFPSSSATTAAGFDGSEKAGGYSHEDQRSRAARPEKTQYLDEQARVLRASLPHVIRLGWTEAAMLAGAREVGVSPSIVGSFSRKEAALVEFFMDECLQRLIDIIDSDENLQALIPSARVAKLVRTRLEMQAPYISKWPQALSIQALPANIPTSFKQRAMLIDEIWHAAGDESTDVDWYVKRTVLGGIYSTTELYMLTDASPDFKDTWTFLDGRIRDAFDLKKTVQEAKYLAEAVSAGMGGSLQGLMQQVLKNVGRSS
ncbi:OLC1v1037927C1 [Oldenlandia corymbosa var. corymbosa]|uniref:Ubiquinone biosynthesis protein n=1 Tax=Oldenlandia corymbosa var. corymbosa TaxID=529605 RepID=A0AAV1CZ88_OLDCO|nr:OLC1v1037927C1 [Oldenlandia corymbosa var. corymbosa]